MSWFFPEIVTWKYSGKPRLYQPYSSFWPFWRSFFALICGCNFLWRWESSLEWIYADPLVFRMYLLVLHLFCVCLVFVRRSLPSILAVIQNPFIGDVYFLYSVKFSVPSETTYNTFYVLTLQSRVIINCHIKIQKLMPRTRRTLPLSCKDKENHQC